MTWSVRITAGGAEGPDAYHACSKCRHAGYCNISRIADPVGSILTAVDTGTDGHMASGEAELKCSGFEPVQTTEDTPG